MMDNFKALKDRVTMLEELSKRQSQIARLEEENKRLRTENEQLESTADEEKPVTTTTNPQILALSSIPIAGSIVSIAPSAIHDEVPDKQVEEAGHSSTCSEEYFARQVQQAEMWQRAVNAGQERIQVFYLSRIMRNECYQIPGFEPLSGADLPRLTHLSEEGTTPGDTGPVAGSSRLLTLPKELRSKVWAYAVDPKLHVDYKLHFFSNDYDEDPKDRRFRPPGLELACLRLTSRVIDDDLKLWPKPMIVWSYPNWASVPFYLSRTLRSAAHTVSYIEVRCPESVSEEAMDAIAGNYFHAKPDAGPDDFDDLASIFGVQYALREASAQHQQLLEQYFHLVELVTVDIHKVVVLGTVHEDCEDCEGCTKCQPNLMQHWRFKVGRPTK